ncbi:MAG: hypothetical protein COY42_15160, partial [Armatimonadetes bacterium CG_4_10_14_0_8_um_filter_66_14]
GVALLAGRGDGLPWRGRPPFGLGPWVGAQVGSCRGPVLRPGRPVLRPASAAGGRARGKGGASCAASSRGSRTRSASAFISCANAPGALGDMWKPYLNVIAAWLPQAVHVLDRFHIMKKMNEALDEVRRAEARRLKAEGYEPVLQNSRWCLLKRPQNLTDKTDRQAERVATVQPPERARLSAAGGLPAVLAVRQPLLGGQVPGRVVHADHAEQDRADEESGSQPAPAPPADPQLVPRQRRPLSRRRRRAEQQSQTDYQKSLRLPHLQSR